METAGRIDAALATDAAPAIEQQPAAPPEPKPAPPQRSDAIALLAAFQRDGRLVDFLMEPIDGFTDEQLGAAARDLHRGCAATLTRLAPVQPIVDAEDGTTVAASDFTAGAVRSIGGDATAGPLLHPGWKVKQTKLPVWTGTADEAAIIMPAEIQG